MSVRIQEAIPLPHTSYIFPLVHKQKKPVARKLNVIYIFFVPLDWSNNSNNKQLYIKTSLPSDLILNTSFLSTQSKAANTTALKSQHRRRESHLTPHGTDCYLDANSLLNVVELNALYRPQEGNPGVKKLQVSISGPNSWTLAIPNVCVADFLLSRLSFYFSVQALRPHSKRRWKRRDLYRSCDLHR